MTPGLPIVRGLRSFWPFTIGDAGRVNCSKYGWLIHVRGSIEDMLGSVVSIPRASSMTDVRIGFGACNSGGGALLASISGEGIDAHDDLVAFFIVRKCDKDKTEAREIKSLKRRRSTLFPFFLLLVCSLFITPSETSHFFRFMQKWKCYLKLLKLLT